MAVDMKQTYRRVIEEMFGRGNYDVLDEVAGPGYQSHDPVTGEMDAEGTKEMCRGYRTAFPDLTPTILSCIAEGDTVSMHWRMTGTHQKPLMGIAPTGRRCTVEGMSLGHFRGGKLVEEWAQWDALGLMAQLGVAQSAEASANAIRTEPGQQPHA